MCADDYDASNPVDILMLASRVMGAQRHWLPTGSCYLVGLTLEERDVIVAALKSFERMVIEEAPKPE